jgi:cytochrome c biogenesis protein CcmG/thiol:disulfide interchange protein DsbE
MTTKTTKTTKTGKTKATKTGKAGARTTRSGSGKTRPVRARPAPTGRFPWLLTVTAVAIVLAALAAVAVALTSDDGAEATAFDEARATVDGTALVPLPDTGADPAVGQTAPVVEGRTRDGTTLRTPTEGQPTVVLFLAHWCPHCQREVPVVQGWIDAGEWPEGVDLVAVSTAVDPARPNHPPSAWLERERWSTPTIADADATAAAAYGLTGFPFWVAIDDQGVVVERRSGELSLDQLVALADAASGASHHS